MSSELSSSNSRRVRRVRRVSPPPPPAVALVSPSRRPARWRPIRWQPWLALLPLGGVALGGGTTRWSQGIVLLALAGVLLIAPPRASLGRWLNGVLGALVLLALTAFLPARWFSCPAWRAALTDDFGTVLPATLSPQPWLSAENLVLFLAGLAWFYRMATTRWTTDERLRAGRLFAGGVVVLAAVSVTLYKLGLTVPFWVNERHFGPFPNRNQTADFLAVGALPVLACGYVAWRGKRRPAAVGWLLGWLVVATAVFNNFSRAGVGILFIGTAAYLVVESIRAARNRRPPVREVKAGDPLPNVALTVARWRRVALGLSLILVLGSGFFLFGGDTLGRFQFDSVAGAEAVVTDELRGQIQRDAVGMIDASPWCGVGLANFAPVFEEYRHRSARPIWLIHPESDWLWIAGELGWPAAVLVLAGCALVARRMWPWPRGTDRPLRTAAGLAAGLFALHGFVDVSAHRPGTALCALFLLGLAMPETTTADGDLRTRDATARRVSGVFRALAVGFAAVGVLWLMESAGWVTAPGLVAVTRLETRAGALGHEGDYADAEQAAQRALAWAPLNWELYFARGVARVCLRQEPAEALADFRRARYLQPFAGSLCHIEAGVWAAADQPALAVSALAEACRREPEQAARYINDVTDVAAGGKAAFREAFQRALRHDPALQMAYLYSRDPGETGPITAAMAADNPDLSGFSERQTTGFLRLWAQHGDALALTVAMDAHPVWQRQNWRWWATACARAGFEEQACGIAVRYAPVPPVPPAPAGAARPLAALQEEAARAPRDPGAALRLYRAQNAAGDARAAFDVLHRGTVQPGCPAYFLYLEALQAAQIGQWHDAWGAWQGYLLKTLGER